MQYQNILADIRDGILTVTINRPDKMNALNVATISELKHAFESALSNPEVMAILITGSGEKAFIAGADIEELSRLDVSTATQLAENGHQVFNLLQNSPKPTLAAVNGFALGGGCELAISCHVRVASEKARFGQPEVKLGIIPGYGGTQRFTQLVGKGKALELMMTGDMIDAQEAHRLGLANYVVSPEEIMEFSRNLLRKMLQNAPLALAKVIASVNAHFDKNADGFTTEIREFANCVTTSDFQEGTSAFLEKRKANFKGE